MSPEISPPNHHSPIEQKESANNSLGVESNVYKRKMVFDNCQEDFRNPKKGKNDFSGLKIVISVEPDA